MDKTEIARMFASLRPKRQLTCPVCGTTFEGMGRRRYCSPKCRVKAFYYAHRQQSQPPTEEGSPEVG